jgi:hypothetical protein
MAFGSAVVSSNPHSHEEFFRSRFFRVNLWGENFALGGVRSGQPRCVAGRLDLLGAGLEVDHYLKFYYVCPYRNGYGCRSTNNRGHQNKDNNTSKVFLWQNILASS